MDYSIFIPAALLFSGSVVFGINVWLLSRLVNRLFVRLGDQDAFIRAAANTQAYLTVEDRKEEPQPPEHKTVYNRVIE